MHQAQRARRAFGAWIALTLAKAAVAARLPLFVDEAFYWQEGRHLAWAYSDLPGLTAWLARLGTELGGNRLLALRMPFLAIGAVLPWLLVRIAARAQDDEAAAWKTGLLALLLPLSGTLGLMALPDVPMALATVLCIGAGARLLRGVDAAGLAWLAAGLAIGAFSHYRFAGTIGAGLIALLCLPRGRAVLTDARVWAALAIGAMAWLPLLLWNLHNADAGLRFQLVDRHPWSFQPAGWQFLPVQVLLATPLLFVAMAVAGWRARRAWPGRRRCAISVCSAACPRSAFSCWGSSPTRNRSASTGRCRAIWRCWSSCHACWTRGRAGGGAPPRHWRWPGCLRCWGITSRYRCRPCASPAPTASSTRAILPAGHRWRQPYGMSLKNCRRAPASSPTISSWAPNWGSRWAMPTSPCSTTRSTASMAGRHNCACGGWKAEASLAGGCWCLP
jgi:hypothetical protein